MNINPTILDSTGREAFHVGGAQAWKQTVYRGYNVSLEWFIGQRSFEPMLAVWPIRGERDSGVWGICLSSVGSFCEFDVNDQPTGTPTPYAKSEADITLREVFNRPGLAIEVSTLLDVVIRFIPDLIKNVPVAPMELRTSGRTPLLEIQRIENGKVVAEVTL